MRRWPLSAWIVACALTPTWSHADEWSAQAGLDVHYKSNDNIRLRTTSKTGVQGIIAAPHASARWRTETSEVSADLGLEFEKYDVQRFDSDNQDLTLHASHQFERNALSIDGIYNRDSTVTTELLDSGFIEDKASRRVQRRIIPEWQWQITPRQLLDTTVSYEDTSYSSSAYTDYHFTRAATTWTYLLTPRWQLQVQPYASRYESQNSPRTITSDTYGLQGGYIWLLSEQMQWSVLAGASHQKTEYDPPLQTLVGCNFVIFGLCFGPVYDYTKRETSNAFVGQTNFSWMGEYWKVTFNASSSEQPSADGSVRQFTQAILDVNWQPLRHMRVDLKTLAGKNSSNNSQNLADRKFGSARLRVSWQVAEQWWVRGSYEYRFQKYSNEPSTATDNAVYLTLSWVMPRRVW